MAKITAKADLVLGTNYRFHLVDFQGTDIAIDATGSAITSTTTDFTAQADTGGIVKRAVLVGDVLTISSTASAGNEGVRVLVTAVSANSISFTVVSGTPVDEAAGADINIQAFKKTYEFLEAGGLSFVDGVDALTWASEIVDLWDAGDFDIYSKIYTSIEPRAKSLACLNGWEPHNTDTLKAHRGMAMEIRDSATSSARRVYFCAQSGSLHALTDKFTYWPATDAEMDAPTAAVTTGYINELILLVDTDNAIDNRGNWTFRCLEPGKTHLQEVLDVQYAEIKSVSSNNGIDPKLADGAGALKVSDATVSAGGIYANIDVNVDVDSLYDGDVDGTLYSFTGFVDGDTQTNENVHFKLHYLLRQPVSINADGTGPDIRGDKAPPISSFLGETFILEDFYLLNYSTEQRNNLRLIDLAANEQKWPSVYTLTITAPSIAYGGTFSLIHANTYGNSAPVYLKDENGIDQKDIAIAASVPIVLAYSTYANGGHTPDTPIDLVLTWNRPGFIEPDAIPFVQGAANQTQNISAQADPSYAAA